MHNVLITGVTGFLGSYLALEYLMRTSAVVHVVARPNKGREAALRVRGRLEMSLCDSGHTPREAEECVQAWQPRIHLIDASLAASDWATRTLPTELDQVWHVAGAMNFAERYRSLVESVNIEGTRQLLTALSKNRLEAFNYVSTAYVAGAVSGTIREEPREPSDGPTNNPYEWSKRAAEELVRAASGRFSVRIFRPSIVVGDSRTHRAQSNVGLYGFLTMVERVKYEIEGRLPGYFDQYPLSVLMSEGVGLNMIPIDRAVRSMFEIAARPDTAGIYHIVAERPLAATRVCELIAEAYGIDVRAVYSAAKLNPIDWVLAKKVEDFDCYLKFDKDFSLTRTRAAYPDARQSAAFSEKECASMIRSYRAGQQLARRRRNEDETTQLQRMEKIELRDEHVEPLTVFRAGSGDQKLIILNAFGQSPVFWSSLLETWQGQYQTLLIQPRGTAGNYPAGLRFEQQVTDLKRVLESEGDAPVHLVGWCTAPKVMLQYAQHNPERIASMCFVTGAFYGFSGTTELATSYERTMEPLCRRVLERPELARFVMDALGALLTGQPGLDSVEQLQVSEILSLVSKAVKPLVIAPFLREESLLNYAAQLLDFWARDLAAVASSVSIPTLFIAAEGDKIASPEMSRAVCRRMQNGSFLSIRGANHYCMYENHELLAELLATFWDDPRQLRRYGQEVTFDTIGAGGTQS